MSPNHKAYTKAYTQNMGKRSKVSNYLAFKTSKSKQILVQKYPLWRSKVSIYLSVKSTSSLQFMLNLFRKLGLLSAK